MTDSRDIEIHKIERFIECIVLCSCLACLEPIVFWLVSNLNLSGWCLLCLSLAPHSFHPSLLIRSERVHLLSVYRAFSRLPGIILPTSMQRDCEWRTTRSAFILAGFHYFFESCVWNLTAKIRPLFSLSLSVDFVCPSIVPQKHYAWYYYSLSV